MRSTWTSTLCTAARVSIDQVHTSLRRVLPRRSCRSARGLDRRCDELGRAAGRSGRRLMQSCQLPLGPLGSQRLKLPGRRGSHGAALLDSSDRRGVVARRADYYARDVAGTWASELGGVLHERRGHSRRHAHVRWPARWPTRVSARTATRECQRHRGSRTAPPSSALELARTATRHTRRPSRVGGDSPAPHFTTATLRRERPGAYYETRADPSGDNDSAGPGPASRGPRPLRAGRSPPPRGLTRPAPRRFADAYGGGDTTRRSRMRRRTVLAGDVTALTISGRPPVEVRPAAL
jgi:hypothetical protein